MNTQEKIHLLLVDDDPDDCELMLEVIEAIDFIRQVDVAGNGEEMMAVLRWRLPDLIILDLNMPRKGGMEILAELKRDPRFHNIPVVIFTTSDQEDDICGSYALGANSFIVKPYSYEGMKSVLESVVWYWGRTVKLPPRELLQMCDFSWPQPALSEVAANY